MKSHRSLQDVLARRYNCTQTAADKDGAKRELLLFWCIGIHGKRVVSAEIVQPAILGGVERSD